jgi:hypothetical protein
MSNIEKLLLILLLIVYLGYLWGIPKNDIFNAIISILVAAITVGIIFRKRKSKSD